jgi:mono/diheme cytochrome c family protein
MKRFLRWTGAALGAVVGLVVLALAAVYGVSEFRMRKTYDVPAVALSLRDDSASIARGRHIATIRGCIDCHTGNLAGGKFVDVPLLGTVYAANLTRGKNGAASFFTDADWDRAIRHGVKPDGKPLLIMPAQEYRDLSDEDLAAVVAYLKSVPPVDTEPAKNRVGPLGRILEVTGKAVVVPASHLDHTAPRKPAPPAGPTAEYGAYLITACSGCHGENLSGGPVPGSPPDAPPALNLTPDPTTGLGKWTEADFTRALREGKKPDGSDVRAPMPWKLTAQLTDDEIHALWLYLRAVPPRGFEE